MYDINIEDNRVILSEVTPTFSYGYSIDFDKISSFDCLRLMDKFKRLYYNKLKESVEVANSDVS